MIDLDRGLTDAAAAGLTLQDWMDLMEKDGAKVKDMASLQQITIGKDMIVVIHHKITPFQNSQEQLKGIFSGKITNWKDAGGKDMPITVVWGNLSLELTVYLKGASLMAIHQRETSLRPLQPMISSKK